MAPAQGRPGPWMVLQGFGWSDLDADAWDPAVLKRPGYDQLRYMAFDAIANGARGLFWWGTHKVEDLQSPFWADLKRVARELADLEPLLAAPDAGLQVQVRYDATAQSLDRGIVTCTRRVADRVLLVVVNEHSHRLAFNLDGLDVLAGRTLDVRGTWERLPVQAGTVRFGLPGLGCAVLVTE